MSDLDLVSANWSKGLQTLDAYMQGRQGMRYLADATRQEFGEDVLQLVLNFPELVVDAHNDRLDVEGFTFPGEADGNETLWSIWQANNMDEQSVMGHNDALGLSRAAVIVGPGRAGGDAPIISVESPFDVSWKRDPATGAAVLAQKCWAEDDHSQWRNVYTPTSRLTLTLDRGGWRVVSRWDHNLGRLPFVPLVNRPRIKLRDGRSEFDSVMGIADAANKIATDMMTSAEYHAMPRRWAFGLNPDDFKNADGSRKDVWSFIKGHLWASADKDIKVGQFDESDLANFHNTIKLLARTVGMMTAMPIDYMAFDSVNPPSADALRAAESRLVKRVERRQVSFGGCWEEVMRIALAIDNGAIFDPQASRLETVWRDPSTPTVAQKYDAITKAVIIRGADGRPLLPTEQARIDLGYTPAQRAEMTKMEQDAAASDPVLSAVRELNVGGNEPASSGN